MLYHRFSTLVHITASTNLRETKKARDEKFARTLAERLTRCDMDDDDEHDVRVFTDKEKSILEKSTSIWKGNSPGHKKVSHLKDIFEENMEKLQGSLYKKKNDNSNDQKIETVEKFANKWKSTVISKKKNSTSEHVNEREITELMVDESLQKKKLFTKRERTERRNRVGPNKEPQLTVETVKVEHDVSIESDADLPENGTKLMNQNAVNSTPDTSYESTKKDVFMSHDETGDLVNDAEQT